VIRALIVDDEPLAREGLRLRLEREVDVEIVAEAASGEEAVAAILGLEPDLVLLDVQMPGCDGFQVLERVAERHLPEVIFVTAHDRHAVRAFEVNALDYLLKPIEEERWLEAMSRARRELGLGRDRGMPERLSALLDERRPNQDRAVRRLVAHERGRFVLVRPDDIHWARSAGNYVEVRTDRGVFLVRSTLAALEGDLDTARFVRVHRTAIVDLDRVREIQPNENGDFELLLEGGIRIPMSRTYRERVLTMRARAR